MTLDQLTPLSDQKCAEISAGFGWLIFFVGVLLIPVVKNLFTSTQGSVNLPANIKASWEHDADPKSLEQKVKKLEQELQALIPDFYEH